MDSVEYFKYLGSLTTNVLVILNPGFIWQRAFKKVRFFSPANWTLIYDENMKCYVWSRALYGPEAWTLWKADQKYFESF
jgi:hypothetical protein